MINIMYFLICIAATTLGAISGIGGGVVIKPVLDAMGTLNVSAISFLSGCTVLSMSVASLMCSCSGTSIDVKAGTPLAIGATVGGVCGKQIFDAVKNTFGNDGMVGSAQSMLMILLTLGVLVYVLNKSRIRTLQVRHPVVCCLIGLILGVMSGFLGIGGGPINLAVLYYFFSMDTKTVALNSLYIILFSQIASFLMTVLQGRMPEVSRVTLLCMVSGGVLGGFMGRFFSKKMNNVQVDKLFLCMLVLITLISVYNFIRYWGML